jgi:hypothetical protein
MRKRPFINIDDLLLLLGMGLVGWGLYLVEWPLVLVWIGLIVMFAGAFRLGLTGRSGSE